MQQSRAEVRGRSVADEHLCVCVVCARAGSPKSSSASEVVPDDIPAGWPAGVARRVDEEGVGWVDYRPEKYGDNRGKQGSRGRA